MGCLSVGKNIQMILKYHPLQIVCSVFYATQQVHSWNYVNICNGNRYIKKLSTAHILKLKPFAVVFSIDIVVSFKKSIQIGQETG